MDGIWRIVNTARITLGLKRSLNPGVKGCGVGRLSRRGNGDVNVRGGYALNICSFDLWDSRGHHCLSDDVLRCVSVVI